MKHKQLISRLKDIETCQAWEAETISEAIKEIKRLKKKVKKWKKKTGECEERKNGECPFYAS